MKPAHSHRLHPIEIDVHGEGRGEGGLQTNIKLPFRIFRPALSRLILQANALNSARISSSKSAGSDRVWEISSRSNWR
jgi:hypothetical protein